MLNSRRFAAALLLSATLAACSPDYNWRQVQPADATFSALFPAKTSSHTQQVNLDGIRTDMAMTAAEVNGVMFAIGSASLPSAALVQPALAAMKTAMVKNIGGAIASDKPVAGPLPLNEVVADGSRNGRPLRLTARFGARGQRVYQVVVIGAPQDVPTEALTTFFDSFKPGS
ncbi:MAG: hypothetical protein ACJ8G3_18235 [Burkholderiaceae bacterium]